MSLLTFSGKNILILGASCEIGQQLASLAQEEGLTPYLAMRFVDDFSEKANLFPFDLANAKTFDSLPLAKIDYVVDLAHSHEQSLVASHDPETIANYFQQNVVAKATLLKLATRAMLPKKSGRLIYLSSTATTRLNAGQGFYASSKSACEKLYQAVGIELAAKGITTAILRAGYIDAGRAKSFLAENPLPLKSIPTQRVLTPEEVAANILYLCSDQASSINAAILTLDGGLTINKATQ